MRHSRAAPRRPWALTSVALACVAGVAMAGRARADDERISLRAELGGEYDSNVHHTEQGPGATSPAPVGSPLARAVLAWSAADRLGQHQDVAFSLLGAAKLFTVANARSENVGIVSTGGSWRLAAGPRTSLGISGAYYEAVQAGSPTEQQLNGPARDFRSLSPLGRIARSVGDHGTVALGGGYRWFVFKPNRDYDFQAPVLSLDYQLSQETEDRNAEWDLLVGAGAELRRFSGIRLVPENGACSQQACVLLADPSGTHHQSQFLSGHASVTRTGTVLIGAGYSIQWNRSNSYAHALIRHVGNVRFTAPLPLGVYLAARTELVYVTYLNRAGLEGGSGQAFTTIEESENMSQLRGELSRDLSTHLQLVARYSLYINPLGQSHYTRQTASLSLAFTID